MTIQTVRTRQPKQPRQAKPHKHSMPTIYIQRYLFNSTGKRYSHAVSLASLQRIQLWRMLFRPTCNNAPVSTVKVLLLYLNPCLARHQQGNETSASLYANLKTTSMDLGIVCYRKSCADSPSDAQTSPATRPACTRGSNAAARVELQK